MRVLLSLLDILLPLFHSVLCLLAELVLLWRLNALVLQIDGLVRCRWTDVVAWFIPANEWLRSSHGDNKRGPLS
jgi:hypothetical protein